MTFELFKIFTAVFIVLVTLLGGLWPFLKKAQRLPNTKLAELEFPVGESAVSGIFLGAALLHMLPNAAQYFDKAGYTYPFPFLIASLSFLLLLLLEHLSVYLKHHSTYFTSGMILLTVIMLSIHALLEGVVIGVAVHFSTIFIIFLAIIAHKSAESFALSINLNRGQLSLTYRIVAFSIFAVMTPIGILGGSWLLISEPSTLLMPIFSSLAAGTFLYIGTLHGLERASLIKHCCNMKEFFFMFAGFILMAVIAIWT